jgi:hypothetical protein
MMTAQKATVEGVIELDTATGKLKEVISYVTFDDCSMIGIHVDKDGSIQSVSKNSEGEIFISGDEISFNANTKKYEGRVFVVEENKVRHILEWTTLGLVYKDNTTDISNGYVVIK